MAKNKKLLDKKTMIQKVKNIINRQYSGLTKNTYIFLYLENNNFNKPKYIEVEFDKVNFIHLTGIKFINTMSKNMIYDKIKNNKYDKNFLKNIDYDINNVNTNMILVNKKISVMEDLFKIENLTKVGKYTDKNKDHINLIISNGVGNNKAYIGFDKKNDSNYLYPKSVLKKDIEKDCECNDILITLSKSKNEKRYKNIVYLNPNMTLPSDFYNTLSSSLKIKIDETILINTTQTTIIEPKLIIKEPNINLDTNFKIEKDIELER